jgi:aldehyde dehydrogenase (NAD+)
MIAATLDRLRMGFDSHRTRTRVWRLQQFAQLRALLTDNRDTFINALQQDLGKPAFETETTELQLVISEIDHASRHLRRWMKPQRAATPLIAQLARSYTLAEPKGVALIIGAWNYPIQLLGAPLVGAIAAGNAVVLKPSELAPNIAKVWAELIPTYLDIDCFAVIEGGVAETSELLRHRFDHILYTGGSRVAHIVMTAAAQHLTPVTLELGGKSPCLVAADADIELTAKRLVWGKFLNAGQTCIAPDYALVERRVMPDLIDAVKHWLVQFYGEDPAASPDYARIVNAAHFDRLSGLLTGQSVVHGGRRDRDSRYFETTLVSEAEPDSALMQEEIFGPILPILSVDHIEAAIQFVRERPAPLALYLFTSSRSTQQSVIDSVSAGSICINDTLMFMAATSLPFGGVGASGMGRYHGWYGFETFSHMKAVMRRSLWPDPSWRYPPFTSRKLDILRRLW